MIHTAVGAGRTLALPLSAPFFSRSVTQRAGEW
jgi:hypothetical protein